MRPVFVGILVALTVSSCTTSPTTQVACPDLTGAYLADGDGFEDSRRTKANLGRLPPLEGRQAEPGVVTVVRIEGPDEGRLVFSAGDVSRELYRVELGEGQFRCEGELVLVEVSQLEGHPILLTGGVSTESGAFRAGPDGSLYVHSFERDSGFLLGLPISIGLDKGWSRFRRYSQSPADDRSLRETQRASEGE